MSETTTIKTTNELGEKTDRTFAVHSSGGYVYEVTASGDRKQVCDGLTSTGSTLMWSPSNGDFTAYIRRERRRGLAATRRAMAR